MNTESISNPNRRLFLKAGALSAFAGMNIPQVFAEEDNTLRLALIGCGGRGSGAAKDALSSKVHPTKLVAMADVFDSKLRTSLSALSNEFANQPGRVDVPQDKQFVGFDGYKKAIDCLRAGDIAIMATPLAFRWVHFKYAIDKGINIFMEKPLTADAPTSKRMLELNKLAKAKNLKVAVGLMVRHCRVRQELWKRIRDGEIGDIVAMRAYRMHPPVASAFSEANKVMNPPDGKPEVMYQIERFHSFLWASGGLFNDFNIHQIDECSWMKDAWPVKVLGIGGRHYRKNEKGQDYVDQNFDTYECEYTYADGSKLFWNSRIMKNCTQQFHSFAHGTKGSAVITMANHTPGNCRTYRGQQINKDQLIWKWAKEEEENPYQLEWDDLLDAIKNNKEYNEVDRGVMASLVSSAGRHSAHTGQELKIADFMEHDHEFAPNIETMTADGPAPVLVNAEGKYPIPIPGVTIKNEY